MKTFRVGIIGTGRKAGTIDDEYPPDLRVKLGPVCHAGAYKAVGKTEIVAAASRGEGRLRAFGERWGVRKLYTDYREMLDKEELDIVSVTTQCPLHAEVTIEAAKSGVKGIICEKAMATSLEEADKMIRACKENDIKLVVNHPRRWNARYQNAKELINQGEIGDVMGITSFFQGALIHNGTHMFDLVRFFMGDVDWVFGWVTPKKESERYIHGMYMDDGGSGYIRLKTGASGLIYGEEGLPWEVGLHGTRGEIILSDTEGFLYTYTEKQPLEERYWKGRTLVKTLHAFPEVTQVKSEMVLCIEDLINWIETGRESISTGYDGRAALEIGLAFHKSTLEGGKKIKLPLEDRKLRVISR